MDYLIGLYTSPITQLSLIDLGLALFIGATIGFVALYCFLEFIER